MDKSLYFALELVIVCKLLATNKYTAVCLNIDNQNIALLNGLCSRFRFAIVYFCYTTLAQSLFNLCNLFRLLIAIAVDCYRDSALLGLSIFFTVVYFGYAAFAQSLLDFCNLLWLSLTIAVDCYRDFARL